MTTSTGKLSHAAIIIPIKNIETALPFYEQKLGFEVTSKWGNPIDYATLKREGVNIHLTKRNDANQPSTAHVVTYIFVYDVNSLYEEYLSKDVTISRELGTREYGMRDFDITDPDGHILSFGMGVSD